MKWYAGFDPGRLPWNGMDLLHVTNHVPEGNMLTNYQNAINGGAVGFRDGLPWQHDRLARLSLAGKIGHLPVIWDMVHFDLPPDPVAHAEWCGSWMRGDEWAVAVNEPTIHAHFLGEGSHRLVDVAKQMMTAAPRLNYATCDPFHRLNDAEFWATDRLVETGQVKLVGINYYAHHADHPLPHVVQVVKERYDLPVAITETGFHDGHPGNEFRWPSGWTRADWRRYVEESCEGDVEFACWYPWLDMPCWNGTGEIWRCGWPSNG